MADLVDVAPFQGRLQVDSTTQISLQRFNGKYIPLKIGGTWSAKIIPASGPTLANTGLTAATKYYIYAYDNAGTLTLEASTTAYATDADTAVPIKNADASRTLVAVVYMGAGTPGTFQALGLGTLNWWNRDSIVLSTDVNLYTSKNNAAYGEVSTSYRTHFIVWSGEAADITILGSAGPNAAADAWVAIAVDTTVKAEQYQGTAGALFGRLVLHAHVTGLSEGVDHYATLYSKESTTQYFNGNNTVQKTNGTVIVTVQG